MASLQTDRAAAVAQFVAKGCVASALQYRVAAGPTMALRGETMANDLAEKRRLPRETGKEFDRTAARGPV
eukprot:CAMPEP_0171910804 /NCGR_PEP_ID=MMETSP0993-20121228/9712_1 /TAXON_ID=483369 /ORGANISM="non described non described, Strain CCMP2098" /LENGTH=69 /DNA_ID=CAMNT_0012544069 /DNA_START=654 /DNA_END=863 /DNA_ORIENTATION=-